MKLLWKVLCAWHTGSTFDAVILLEYLELALRISVSSYLWALLLFPTYRVGIHVNLGFFPQTS